MGLYKRINVSSGRSLEKRAHYSRALRVGDRVLQAGTTAIDRDGNVIGEGDVARQVDAIMALAEWSMGKAGGKIEDIVRSRIYLTDISLTGPAALALAKYFRDIRPTSTLVQVSRLARPTQLVEIEFDAVDGAKDKAQRVSSGRAIEDRYAYSRAVRVDDRVFISGSTALNLQGTVDTPDDMYTQARQTFDTILWALDQLGGTPGDLMNAKTFVTDLAQNEASARARRDALGDVYPTATLLGIPALVRPDMLIEIESDAMLGAASHRREIFRRSRAGKVAGLCPCGRGWRLYLCEWLYLLECGRGG
jgi:enamine deaminase RidA (YjgF/YER057c/UK114 family)